MSKGIYPKAVQKLIAPGANDPRIQPVGACLHVAVSTATSLFGYFSHGSGGIESHFYVRKDGTVEQYRDCLHEADAQNAGNSWVVGSHRNGVISIESEGMALGKWNAAQLAAIKDLLLWLNTEFGIPLRQIPSAQPAAVVRGGVGYHSLFPSWNTSHHSCPGPVRVRQFKNKLVPWMAEQKPAPVPVPPLPEVLKMELTDKITIPSTYASNQTGKDEQITVETLLRRMYDWTFRGTFGTPAK